MDDPGSVTNWIRSLRDGDQEAAACLWDRYFRSLAGIARARLGTLRAAADQADDVALSAFYSFCRQAEAGRFAAVQGRDDLWRVLVVITKRKAVSWLRHETAQKRGGNQIRGEAFLAEIVDKQPTPDFMAELLDELRHLLDAVHQEDPTLALIAVRRLEGYSNTEIAAELSLSPRSVERKVQRICVCWSADADARMTGDAEIVNHET